MADERADQDPPDAERSAEGQAPAARAAELEHGRMPFFEHLRELRTRLRNSIIALLGGFIVAYIFKQELFVLLARPLIDVWAELAANNPAVPDAPALYFNDLIGPFWTYFSIAFWAGIFVASPLIFYQLWRFIAPGLYKNERRMGVAFAAASAFFFIGGATFCYFLVLPEVFSFLLGYSSTNLADMTSSIGVEYSLGDAVSLQPLLGMGEYLAFAKKILIGFGLAFELPLVIFFLSIIGMVTHRGLWKFNRWAVVLAFVGSAALTPPDVVSQTFLAGPIVVLYNLSIIIAYFITRRRERAEAALYADDEPVADDEPKADDATNG